MTSAQRACYLKKHKPELYRKAGRIKEQGHRWNEIIDAALGRRKLKPKLEDMVQALERILKELQPLRAELDGLRRLQLVEEGLAELGSHEELT